MRTTPLALALVLLACGRADHAGSPAAADAPPPASTMRGPDQIALRFPRSGGRVRAYAFPNLDSAVWTSSQAVPALQRVLGFDGDAGSVVGLDAKGAVVRVDLRLGTVSREPASKLTHLASSDGQAVYGISPTGGVVRLTPSGNWTFDPPHPARDIVPAPDGSLYILADRGSGTVVWHIFPPESAITDTLVMPRLAGAPRTEVGDRVYFAVDSGLVGFRTRDAQEVPSVPVAVRTRAMTTTPSGDRVYLASDSAPALVVIDRFRNRVEARIPLPGPAIDLRMDPTGRYLLARPAQGDSAWVVAVGTDRVLGTVRTAWRGDLPAVAGNGAILLVHLSDVALVDGETLRPAGLIPGGAKDTWLMVAYNGFRPRAKGLDVPVTFPSDTSPSTESAPARDSALHDTTTGTAAGALQPSAAPAPPAPAARPSPAAARPDSARRADGTARAGAGFTVQFAALRAENAARAVRDSIHVAGNLGGAPRVVATTRSGVTIFRVIAGPFPTRAEADRVARSSGRTYWIYEGAP